MHYFSLPKWKWPGHPYARLVCLLLAFSLIAIYALAYPLNPNRIFETLLFCLLLHRFAPRLLTGVLWLTALLVLLYRPTAALYGRPSFGIVASLFSTNTTEAWEYLQVIPLKTYLGAMVMSLCILWLARQAGRIKAPGWGWKWALPLLVLMGVMVHDTARGSYAHAGFMFRIMPLEFVADSYLMPRAYFAELDQLNKTLDLPSAWDVAAVHQPYRNYVLVIGESMRPDYMSLYGYKISDTPFLEKNANIVMEQVMAPGPNTPISLLHALALTNGRDFRIQDNLIALAKAAHMETVWLSNQGALGKYDTSISAIARKADVAHFLKTSGYDFGKPTYDDELLPPLQQILEQPLSAGKNRLIVLHLLGSHPNTCERLRQPPQAYSDNLNTNCYIDSIRQTDTLLQQVNGLLAGTQKPYSLLYFSDHGLSHDRNTFDKYTRWVEKSVLRHNDGYVQNYRIPFVVVHSDATAPVRYTALRSGFHLLNGFSQWLGIQARNLDTNYQFFGNVPDTDVRVLTLGNDWRAVAELADDPPWTP